MPKPESPPVSHEVESRSFSHIGNPDGNCFRPPFGPLGNALSRHFEKQADLYALENSKEKKAFMTALAGLADRNLSNAYPEWWVKILYYSHPPIGKRLRTEELFGSGPSDIPQ